MLWSLLAVCLMSPQLCSNDVNPRWFSAQMDLTIARKWVRQARAYVCLRVSVFWCLRVHLPIHLRTLHVFSGELTEEIANDAVVL